MLAFIEYAVTWLFFMAIIAGICLMVPKIAPKISKLIKQKGASKSIYGLSEDEVEDGKAKSEDKSVE